MNEIIGADAAKLAGLQIDTLAKVRAGNITLAQWEWFNNLNDAERDQICGFPSPQKNLNLKQFLNWLKKNKLEQKFSSGLMNQIAEQEIFYQKFYGKIFQIDRKKIIIEASRLPAIKAGLEAGCLNRILLLVTPKVLTETERKMTESEFFFRKLMIPQKRDGLKIWAETGTDRWTNLELAELLVRCNPTELEEFNPVAFKKDWVAEIKNILGKKNPPPKIQPGTVRTVFTSDLVDILSDQKIVNKTGKIVTPEDHSYISAINSGVRVLSHAEGIVLEAQMFAKDKTYIARNTWEWRRDLIDHQDKKTNPVVSVADANSSVSGFHLNSYDADDSGSGSRLRLAL